MAYEKDTNSLYKACWGYIFTVLCSIIKECSTYLSYDTCLSVKECSTYLNKSQVDKSQMLRAIKKEPVQQSQRTGTL